ncbi:MAG: GntR family transcriptional regulator [Pseudomonadota bacterium]
MTGFRDIRDTLLARIRSGSLPPGAALPSEIDLAAEFGVARATVSRAIADLAADGLVDRRRRAGTTVSRAPVRKAQVEIVQAGTEISALGQAYTYQLLDSAHPVPDHVATALGPVLGLLCMHLADGTPWQVEERWINTNWLPDGDPDRFQATPPGPWLIEKVPLTDARFVFEAAAAPDAIASHLGLTGGTPSFVGERATWQAGQPVTIARLWHRPGYQMTFQHSPGSGALTG